MERKNMIPPWIIKIISWLSIVLCGQGVLFLILWEVFDIDLLHAFLEYRVALLGSKPIQFFTLLGFLSLFWLGLMTFIFHRE